MSLAPIILFVYNRPWHTQQTVEALQKNELAAESDLFIFADGPKPNSDQECLDKIKKVRQYIHTIDGFKSITIEESPENKGLANSIIEGVTKTINQFGKVIVVEDDIVVSSGFLNYMNDALLTYQNELQVMHISGYMYPIKHNWFPSTFFYPATSCWGWATWNRAWKHFNPDARYLYQEIKKKGLLDTLNINTIHNFEQQLIDNITGKLNTWFIKWNASVLLCNGYSLYPKTSLVQNIGFDYSGEHCSTTNLFYCSKLAKYINVKKKKIQINQHAVAALKKFGKTSEKKTVITFFKKVIRRIVRASVPELSILRQNYHWDFLADDQTNVKMGKNVKLTPKYNISDCIIGDYTYIAQNSIISKTTIGKFCSIGPNLVCGWGIHPTNGISTSPMFYSTLCQNGMTLSSENKIEERKPITIGNDVFIGANVTILDGVTIGDGAVIGAGAVVSKDIPPYAVAVGCPIRIKNYRFEPKQIEKLLELRWWNFNESELKIIEKNFFDLDDFLQGYDTNKR